MAKRSVKSRKSAPKKPQPKRAGTVSRATIKRAVKAVKKRRGGQLAFKPTEGDRRTVEAMAAYGIPQTEIARVIGKDGIDPKTLRKHFDREIDIAEPRMIAKVAESLFNRATGKATIVHVNPDGSKEVVQAGVQGDVGACCFILKCRAGWKEKNELALTGADGGPIRTEVTLDLSGISREDLKVMEAILEHAAQSGLGEEGVGDPEPRRLH